MAAPKRRARTAAPRKAGSSADAAFDPYTELWAEVQPANSRRLLIAALESFAAHGFEAATTRDIAERAGMSSAAVYVHYRSKDELLFEIVRTGHEHVLAHVNDALDAGAGAPDQLRSFMETYASWHARFHTLASVSQFELRYLPPRSLAKIRRIRRQFMQRVEAILEEGASQRQLDVIDVHGTARALLSLGIDVARWYQPDGALAPQDIGRLYGELGLRLAGHRTSR